MITCEGNCNLSSASSLHWSDSAFVLIATGTGTVAAGLNIGLLISTIQGGVASKHPITLQLCVCGLITCAALFCHVQYIWKKDGSGHQLPLPAPCRSLDLATMFSHCLFFSLMLLELKISHRRAAVPLLSIISWCVVAIVSLTAGMNYSPSSAMLVFCFYVLHIPLAALLVINQRSSRVVAPSGIVTLRPPGIRKTLPRVLLLFVGTMPQAFLVALEALERKPFPSADAWCFLSTSLFAAFRPLLDIFFQPELGDAVANFIGSLCRRKASV